MAFVSRNAVMDGDRLVGFCDCVPVRVIGSWPDGSPRGWQREELRSTILAVGRSSGLFFHNLRLARPRINEAIATPRFDDAGYEIRAGGHLIETDVLAPSDLRGHNYPNVTSQ